MRHGQASLNSDHYDRLSEIGIEQSRLLGGFLVESGRRFDIVFTGTMERQRDTATAILEAWPEGERPEVVVVPGLDEHDTFAIIRTLIPLLVESDPALASAVARMREDATALRVVLETVLLQWSEGADAGEGVETYTAFCDRVFSAMDAIDARAPEDAKALIVSSGGPIAMMLAEALGLPAARSFRLIGSIRNASVTAFRREDGALSLLSYNSTAHLERLAEPSLLTYV